MRALLEFHGDDGAMDLEQLAAEGLASHYDCDSYIYTEEIHIAPIFNRMRQVTRVVFESNRQARSIGYRVTELRELISGATIDLP